MRRLLTLTFLLFVVFGLGACSGKTAKPITEIEAQSAEALYAEAEKAMNEQLYRTAARLFDDVERQFPYSEYATQAKLMTAFAHYKALKYDEAVLALDRFIELHPGHKDIAYAYYLRAISFYEQIIDVGRDQEITELAMESLTQVIRRFPETEYARDAKLKHDLTRDHLAGKEMEIGRYYLKRKHYTAGINRFKNVVDNYQTTTHVPEALHRMVESYLAMGLPSEAQRVASVLGYNYPGSKWYEASFAMIKGSNLPEFSKEPTSTFGRLKEKLF